MKRIPISRAEAGMILAEPAVQKPGGAVIVPEGTELTEALLERLRNRNVTFVAIEEASDAGLESTSVDAVLEDMLSRVDARFARVRDDALMTQVSDVYKEVLRERRDGNGK